MTDIADQAGDMMETIEAAQLKERRAAAAKKESHPDFNGQDCVECGEAIPAERLKLFRVRCVECQRIIEHRKKTTGL